MRKPLKMLAQGIGFLVQLAGIFLVSDGAFRLIATTKQHGIGAALVFAGIALIAGGQLLQRKTDARKDGLGSDSYAGDRFATAIFYLAVGLPALLAVLTILVTFLVD